MHKCVYGLVAVKRSWVPEWLYMSLFSYKGKFPNAAVRQPLRWILHRVPNDIERAKTNRGLPC